MSKEKKIHNFQRGIVQFLSGRSYTPLYSEELLEALDIPKWLSPLFNEALDRLIKEERIRKSGGRYLLAETETHVTRGTLRLHRRGFGFVIPDDREACPKDIFIPRSGMEGAVDGDQVEVTLSPSRKPDKGPEGEVLQILKRARESVAGTLLSAKGNRGLLMAPLLGPDQLVEVEAQEPLHEGDRMIVKIQRWASHEQQAYGLFESRIGHIELPASDIPAALAEFEIPSRFPQKVTREAESFGKRVPKEALKNRLDLRSTVCVTIDPESAKDFDDALSLRQDSRGNYHLGVHIADASYYVRPESPLDKEARKRCNSTYFPHRCVPMLPSELSDNLCSLRPNVNRLTVSVLMKLDKGGKLLSHEIKRSVIRSDRRFTYGEAREILEGKRRSKHTELLQQMKELCQLLQQQRRERGTVEFALPEVILEVNTLGEATGTRMEEYDITHQMVEEFMLKANEVVATHLARLGRGLTYRIHEEPDEESLRDFAQLARAFGFRLSTKPTPEEIQELFRKANETRYGTFLAVGYIRSMKLASYSPDNIGHYGLSLEHYCHFTSPIRRYADLVVHRTLLSQEEELDEDELAEISLRCSERERISAKAEESVKQLKKLRLLRKQWREDPTRSWKAVISGVKPFGLIFQLVDLMHEGFIHISRIGRDYYVIDEERMIMTGEKTGETLRCGDTIEVSLCKLDLIRGELEWERYADQRPAPKLKKRGGKRKR